MRINTNISSLTAQENAVNTNNAIKSSLEKLSSGLRINKASDDASGLAIADKLRTQATSINQGVANGNSAVSLLQIADKSMAEQSNILNTVKSKLIQANTDTTSAEGREAIRKDISKLLEQLDNIAEQTNYNGKTLLQAGSGDTETDRVKSAGLAFQIGESNTDIISNKSIQSNSDGLGLADAQETTTTLVAKNEATYEVSVNGTSVSFRSDKDATLDEIHAGLKAAVEGNTELNALVQVEPQNKASSVEEAKFVLTAKEKNVELNVDSYVNTSAPEKLATATVGKIIPGTAAEAEVKELTFTSGLATAGNTLTLDLDGTTISLDGTVAKADGTATATAMKTAIDADPTLSAKFDVVDDGAGTLTITAKGTAVGKDIADSTIGGTAAAGLTETTTTEGKAATGVGRETKITYSENTNYEVSFGGNTISATGADKTTVLANLETAFTALGTTDFTFSKNDATGSFTIHTADTGATDVTVSTAISVDTGKIGLTNTKGEAAKDATAEVKELTFTSGLATAGNTLTLDLDGTTISLDGTVAKADGTATATAMKAAIDADATLKDKFDVVDDGAGTLTITAKGTAVGKDIADSTIGGTAAAGLTETTTTEGEAAKDATSAKSVGTIASDADGKVEENTRYNVKIGSESIDYTAKKGDTAKEVLEGLKAAFDANKKLNSSEDTGYKMTIDTTDIKSGAGSFTITSNATGENSKAATGENTITVQGEGNFTSKTTIDAGEGKALSELKNLEANGLTKDLAAEFQAVVDDAINDLNAYRGDIGSTQNQVESAVRNLMTQATNVKAAESIIRDVDYAAESSNFNKQNIIAQAGSYAISQANSAQKNVMKLLQ